MSDSLSKSDRKTMIELDKNISVDRQCELLSISKSSYYYEPIGESELNLAIMLAMDKIHLDYPFYGVLRHQHELKSLGYEVNEKRIRRLMKKMDMSTIYAKPNLSKACKEHYKYPYLLRNLEINKPNQVWSIDITYIPMKHGFMYLFGMIDWYSRCLLGWSLSNSLDSDFCIETIEEGIKKYGKPSIINSDQGVQFTSNNYTNLLKNNEIMISMDGKGRAIDNIMIERFWRSIKYEDIYLKAYENGHDLYQGISNYMSFYNQKRPHQSLENLCPWAVYSGAKVLVG